MQLDFHRHRRECESRRSDIGLSVASRQQHPTSRRLLVPCTEFEELASKHGALCSTSKILSAPREIPSGGQRQIRLNRVSFNDSARAVAANRAQDRRTVVDFGERPEADLIRHSWICLDAQLHDTNSSSAADRRATPLRRFDGLLWTSNLYKAVFRLTAP
jgi:hypothetical protein